MKTYEKRELLTKALSNESLPTGAAAAAAEVSLSDGKIYFHALASDKKRGPASFPACKTRARCFDYRRTIRRLEFGDPAISRVVSVTVALGPTYKINWQIIDGCLCVYKS